MLARLLLKTPSKKKSVLCTLFFCLLSSMLVVVNIAAYGVITCPNRFGLVGA